MPLVKPVSVYAYPVYSKEALCSDDSTFPESAPFLHKQFVNTLVKDNDTVGVLKPELFPTLYDAIGKIAEMHQLPNPVLVLDLSEDSKSQYNASVAFNTVRVTYQFLGRHGLLPEQNEQGELLPVVRPVSDAAKGMLSHELSHQTEFGLQMAIRIGTTLLGGMVVQMLGKIIKPQLPKTEIEERFSLARMTHALLSGLTTGGTIAGTYLGYIVGARYTEQRTDKINAKLDDRIAGGDIINHELSLYKDSLLEKHTTKINSPWAWYKSLFSKAYKTHDPCNVRIAKVKQHNPGAEAATEQIRQETAPMLRMERCHVELEAAAANAMNALKGQLDEGKVIWPKAASIQSILIDPAQKINVAGRKALDNFAQAVCNAEQARHELMPNYPSTV